MAEINDIAPELIEKVNKAFVSEMNKAQPKLVKITEAIKSGKATYNDAYHYAKIIGNARAKAFKLISSESLPEGKMYFNIADRLIRDTLPRDFDDITTLSSEVQEIINKELKIGIKGQKAVLNKDRLSGFVDRISSEALFDDVAWILEKPVREFCAAAVDETIKANAEFHHNSGVRVTVERSANGGCCEWCNALAGAYTYPGVPGEVFARHDDCRCTLNYNGQKLSAYTSRAGRSNTFRA